VTGDSKAAVIVTNRGGRTCHAAIVSHEYPTSDQCPSASLRRRGNTRCQCL